MLFEIYAKEGERQYTYLKKWMRDKCLVADELEVGTKVYFSSRFVSEYEPLITEVYVNEDGVKVCNVPNILLTEEENIRVTAYSIDEYGVKTEHSKVIEVNDAVKPKDYVYEETPTVNSTIDKAEMTEALEKKQELLVSGTNIKTINGESILGEGNIEIAGMTDGYKVDVDASGEDVILTVSPR